MVGGVRCRLGGITRLLALIDQHGEAIGADLLTIGKRLDQIGTAEFSWWDFMVRVRFAQPDTILHRAVHGWSYDMVTRQMGLLIELLRVANWQRTGNRHAPRPKPIRWPWTEKSPEDTRWGEALPLDEVREALLARTGRTPFEE